MECDRISNSSECLCPSLFYRKMKKKYESAGLVLKSYRTFIGSKGDINWIYLFKSNSFLVIQNVYAFFLLSACWNIHHCFPVFISQREDECCLSKLPLNVHLFLTHYCFCNSDFAFKDNKKNIFIRTNLSFIKMKKNNTVFRVLGKNDLHYYRLLKIISLVLFVDPRRI